MKMKRKICMALAGIMVLTAGCGKTIEEEVVQEEVQVENSIDVFGKIEANKKRDVYINFPALIKEIHIKEGQSITKGTPLFTLEYSGYLNDIKKAEQKLELSNTELDFNKKSVGALDDTINKLEEEKSLKNNYISEDSSHTLELLQSNLNLIEQQIKEEENNYETLQELYKEGGTSEDEVKKSKIRIDGFKKDKISTEKAIIEFQDNIKMQVADLSNSIVSTTEKRLDAEKSNQLIEKQKNLNTSITELEIEDMKEKMNNVYIKDNQVITELDKAIVEEIKCEEGEYVGVNEPTYCVKLLDANSIQAVADVPEEFISDISIGQKCKVTPYYDKTLTIEGEVERISEVAINKDGEVVVQVYVNLLNKDKLILPGFSVDVTFSK